MKVLFIYPNSGSQIGFNYGIAFLSGVLKSAGHQTAFIQLCDDIDPLPKKEEFAEMVRKEAADMIGFSVVTNQWQLTRQYAAWCRDCTDAPLICGGIHATVATEEVLRSGLFDFLFVGESENALLQFVSSWEKGLDWRDTPSLAYLDGEEIKRNPVSTLPVLTDLPAKDYEIFDYQKIIDAKGGWAGLMASRGCPFNCSYCFNHLMVQKYRRDLNCSFGGLNYIRHHSVEQLTEEIAYLERTFANIGMYIFDDDLFTFKRSFVLEFCKAYKQTSDVPFTVNGHVGLWDESRAAALADAGCRIVKFGVESGSERIRRQIMNRRMKNETICEAIDIVRRHGMHSSCFIMIGLPHETEADVFATVRLLARSRPGRFRWTYFYPFPGTEAYRLADEGGFIDFEKFHTLVNFTDDFCLDFGDKQNLLLRKIGKIMPWFVNAHSSLACAPFYRERTEWILAMDEDEWQLAVPTLLDLDKAYSEKFIAEGLSHYAVKYNPFMGVISDYFIEN